jgi:hypothetical protein
MKRFTLVVVAALISGCATGYNAKGLTGGYSDVQIDENTYRVSYSGNKFTDPSKLESLLIYRAADLTVQKGFDWFTLRDKSSEGKWSGQYGKTGTIVSGEVKMYKGKKDDNAYNAYDARSVMQHMASQVK